MKIATIGSRILLGLMFTVFGLNGFLHFFPQPPPQSPLALQFVISLASSNYFAVIFALQLIGGVLLLANRYVPLALTILAPVIVNVLLYHVFLEPAGIAPGVFAAILWTLVFADEREAFAGLFRSATPVRG